MRLWRKIAVIPAHRMKGMPKYIHGHHPNPLRRRFDELKVQRYELVGESAAELGGSAMTFRRMEEEGRHPER